MKESTEKDKCLKSKLLGGKNPEYRNLWKAIHCSLGFFLLEISTNTVQNVQSTAFSDNGYDAMGFLMLSLSYACLAMGCLFAPRVMEKVGFRFCMMAGSFFDTCWIVAQLAPAFKALNPHSESLFLSESFIVIANTIASITSGLGAALLWVAQGKYISDCATPNTKGFFFGAFWAIYMAS